LPGEKSQKDEGMLTAFSCSGIGFRVFTRKAEGKISIPEVWKLCGFSYPIYTLLKEHTIVRINLKEINKKSLPRIKFESERISHLPKACTMWYNNTFL